MKTGWAPNRQSSYPDIDRLYRSLVDAVAKIRARKGQESKRQRRQLYAVSSLRSRLYLNLVGSKAYSS